MRPRTATRPVLALHLFWFVTLLAAMATLTGCGSGALAPASPSAGTALRGHVYGGQQPVAGANVYLLTANTTGYAGAGMAPSGANASISLLNADDTGLADDIGAYVITAADGTFDISGDYNCTPGAQVYLYAHGGNPGGGTNSAAGFLALLGNCPDGGDFSAVPFIEMNEVSTVAAAFSFAGYASDPIHVSSNGSPQALTGMANAFATAANLADLGSGAALTLTPAGNGYPPYTTVNTLGNILAACVNTADTVQPSVSSAPQPRKVRAHIASFSSPCIALGLAVSGDNLDQFTGYVYDTATAAIFIAQSPGVNVDALYTLPTPQAPFSPALTSEPNDFTLGIEFYGGGINSTSAVALDASGNVWFSNAGYPDNTQALTELSPLGAPISPDGGFTGGGMSEQSYGVAIDINGNAWVSNFQISTISEFTSAGIAVSSSAGYTGDGINGPQGLAFDNAGNLWVANINANAISRFDYLGNPASGSGFAGGGLDDPTAVAIDQIGNVWASNAESPSISELDSTGTALSPVAGFTGGGLANPGALAVDSSGNIWVPNTSADSVSEFANNGTPISSSTGFTGGGLAGPNSLSIDGAGNVWAAGEGSASVAELANSGTPISPSTGYTAGGSIYYPIAVATDSAGNVWLTGATNFVTEIIGAAVPIETPTAKALADFCLAQRPCPPPS